mmetsp:Transcript_84665/g.168130  ORF Transcript_84665/g.168130 Transcript_84665/m.168130 type:complete len:666 (-) Transcript_84665:59-2056(-)
MRFLALGLVASTLAALPVLLWFDLLQGPQSLFTAARLVLRPSTVDLLDVQIFPSGSPHDGFHRWMKNAGLVLTEADNGHTMQALRDKLLLRIIAFGYDVLPHSVREEYAKDLAEVTGVELSAERVLTQVETLLKEVLHKEHGSSMTATANTISMPTDEVGDSAPSASAAGAANGGPNYFGFIPQFKGRVRIGSPPLTWESPCWRHASAELIKAAKGWELQVHVSGPKHLFCSDAYGFFTASSLHAGVLPGPIGGTKRYAISSDNLTESEVWDVESLGVRVFFFPAGVLGTVRQILETALLFVPLSRKSVPPQAAQRNVDFLKRYVGIDMKERHDDGSLVLQEDDIQSGDFFGILRLDGLDPMLAWGMGSHTGHTTVALWEDGQLYIAESTTNSSYWPTNGIQRTPYRQWIQQARAAGFAVVHAPLSPKYREIFNEKKANAFFHAHEGLQYGYHALFTGWIDTQRHNYPCLPPYDLPQEQKQCLTWELLEVLVPFVTRFIPQLEKPFLPAWNLHVTGSATGELSATQLYRLASEKGMDVSSIPAVVEQDGAQYPSVYNNGTRALDIAMVCDVLVCSVWKAAGLFEGVDNQVSCVEQTNSDVYNLEILAAPQARKAACAEKDPHNALCQLMGSYELELPTLGTRPVYRHMQESCPSEPPLYKRPDNC